MKQARVTGPPELDGYPSLPVAVHSQFVYYRIMDVARGARGEGTVASIAAAIGEPARARMLYGLMDGRARTSTELAVIAGVSPSTASVHLQRLTARQLIKVLAQGKHRYYSLEGSAVANALEALSVLAGEPRAAFVPTTPSRLRVARTCYDHLAGTVGVLLHDRFTALGWLSAAGDDSEYELTAEGTKALSALG